jgi:hypothetical protein
MVAASGFNGGLAIELCLPNGAPIVLAIVLLVLAGGSITVAGGLEVFFFFLPFPAAAFSAAFLFLSAFLNLYAL